MATKSLILFDVGDCGLFEALYIEAWEWVSRAYLYHGRGRWRCILTAYRFEVMEISFRPDRPDIVSNLAYQIFGEVPSNQSLSMVTKKGAQASACLPQGEADQTIKSHAREGENKGYCEIMFMMYNELDPGMMGLAVK